MSDYEYLHVRFILENEKSVASYFIIAIEQETTILQLFLKFQQKEKECDKKNAEKFYRKMTELTESNLSGHSIVGIASAASKGTDLNLTNATLLMLDMFGNIVLFNTHYTQLDYMNEISHSAFIRVYHSRIAQKERTTETDKEAPVIGRELYKKTTNQLCYVDKYELDADFAYPGFIEKRILKTIENPKIWHILITVEDSEISNAEIDKRISEFIEMDKEYEEDKVFDIIRNKFPGETEEWNKEWGMTIILESEK